MRGLLSKLCDGGEARRARGRVAFLPYPSLVPELDTRCPSCGKQPLIRLGETDGVACTALHKHLLHRLQVKGGLGLGGVDEEGPQRIGFAFGTRCSPAMSQDHPGLMDWAALRLVLVQVKCTRVRPKLCVRLRLCFYFGQSLQG